jgi:hypothetical protein
VVTVDEPAAGLIPTLRGRYYIDPGIFSAEQAAIFESLWFRAMRSADVAGPGGFRTVQIGRENVIVARDTDGELRAFLNLCRHRGARICTEDSGRCAVTSAVRTTPGPMAYPLRRRRELEAPGRELHGLLPLHEHPPGTGGRAAGVRPRGTRPSTSSATRPSSHRRPGVSPSTAATDSVELFHRVNEQDFAACERCQPSMSSRSYAGAECSSPPSSTSPACTNRCAAGSLTTTEPGTSGLKARADPGARPGTRVRRRSQ